MDTTQEAPKAHTYVCDNCNVAYESVDALKACVNSHEETNNAQVSILMELDAQLTYAEERVTYCRNEATRPLLEAKREALKEFQQHLHQMGIV